jgi:pimeloyl-ACP methyl ester carboxylesterase
MRIEKFVAELERADALKLAGILRRPSAEETAVLRNYLGTERFERMHRLAQAALARAGAAEPKGNVVVIPTFLGSELTAFSPGGGQEPIWLNVRSLAADGLDRLRINDLGSPDPDEDELRPTGVLKRYYGELLLALAGRWNVLPFCYDWRKDLNAGADALSAWLEQRFPGKPVHLVAHGSGGLLARAFVARHREQWEGMWDGNPAAPGRRGGRLILLGAPVHGTYLAVQVLAGVAGFVSKLALLRDLHDRDELLKVVLSFPGLYQMLPAPWAFTGAEKLYQGRTYSDLQSIDVEVPQKHLDAAREFHGGLRGVVDPERIHAIVGYGQTTVDAIGDFDSLDHPDAYQATERGDGLVTVDMALLEGVRSLFVDEEHAGLTSNHEVVAAIEDLLATGRTERLGKDPGPLGSSRTGQVLVQAQAQDLRRAEELTRGLRQAGDEPHSPLDHNLEESLTRDLLSPRQVVTRRSVTPTALMKHPRVELSLINGRIASLEYDRHLTRRSRYPVDAIAVGHYLGVKPAGMERELDEAISRAILDLAPEQPIRESDLVLTQYSERGILKGELGHPFFLPDPRDHTGRRVIAIAGMGVPGRFGWPELTVLARELCWSVGRLGKRHLAIASMGTRYGTIPLGDAIRAWIRGLKNAVTGAIESEGRHIERLMIVLDDPRLMEAAHTAILAEINQLEDRRRLEILFDEFTDEKLDDFAEEGFKLDEREMREELKRRPQRRDQKADAELAPTRVTLALEGTSYHFGALTSDASVPERAVPIDPVLVEQANARLAAEDDPDRQLVKGQFLQRLIVPEDLRRALETPAPLVMMLDRETAKIHWEMVAQPEPIDSEETDLLPLAPGDDPFACKFEYSDFFLGTSRGFTRQLRTTFAPPPEPPPPPRRLLRVLVVANPAADAPLPGAEREGHEVADAFEAFNAVFEDLCENRIEVVRLIGPERASRTEVLEHLMLRRYDVLHFAGHCVYDEDNPALSGWVFARDQRISAYELNRVDRVPRFIFSNACESGVLSGKGDLYTPGLAPSFAESFFLRGVSNFVCTAWPVDDGAALEFAQGVYHGLLGLRPRCGTGPKYAPVLPMPMHAAMRQARLGIAGQPHGVRTWGAYQHYGNPYFRFFDPEAMKMPPRGTSCAVSMPVKAETPTASEAADAPPNQASPLDKGHASLPVSSAESDIANGGATPSATERRDESASDAKPRSRARIKKRSART